MVHGLDAAYFSTHPPKIGIPFSPLTLNKSSVVGLAFVVYVVSPFISKDCTSGDGSAELRLHMILF